MKKRDISSHHGHKLKGFTQNKVMTEGGEFDADLILFMPGMTGNQWFDETDLPRSEGGLIRADKYCRVEGMDKVYVAGDSGSFPGPEWMPKQAHMADLQAKAAAANLVAEFNGRAPSETYKVELICIVDSQNCRHAGGTHPAAQYRHAIHAYFSLGQTVVRVLVSAPVPLMCSGYSRKRDCSPQSHRVHRVSYNLSLCTCVSKPGFKKTC